MFLTSGFETKKKEEEKERKTEENADPPQSPGGGSSCNHPRGGWKAVGSFLAQSLLNHHSLPQYAPPKTNMDTQNNHIWKEIQ